MTKDEALKLALEALEEAVFYTSSESWSPSMTRECEAAITALRAAIEQAQELVSTPLPRQWQGLTDEEIHQGFCHVEYETPNDWSQDPRGWCIANARYLEAILKARNS